MRTQTDSSAIRQLAFGLCVGGGMLLLGLWLNTTGQAGFGTVVVGTLLLAINTIQYLHHSGRTDRALIMTESSLKGGTQ